MKILGLACTNGRFSYLERLLACFLNQDHKEKQLLIYNNANIPIEMDPIDNVTLINNAIDQQTNEGYKDVGSIFRDALSNIPAGVDYISIMDDDDVYLPSHFSQAHSVFLKNKNFKVWKPGYYFLKNGLFDVEYRKNDNYLEGSAIISHDFLKECGFELHSLTYHHSWIKKSYQEKNICVDYKNTVPTYCYEIGQPDIVHLSMYCVKNPSSDKTDFDKTLNKIDDYGQGKVLRPWSDDKIKRYFDTYFNLDNFIDG